MHPLPALTPAPPIHRADPVAAEVTDATVLLLVTRDAALAAALFDESRPRPLRLHLLPEASAALAFLARHSPDAVVLDAATALPAEGAASSELVAALRGRATPLVVVTPAGSKARAFLELCSARSLDATTSRGRDAAALGRLLHAGIDRRRNRLRFASVAPPPTAPLPAAPARLAPRGSRSPSARLGSAAPARSRS